MKNYITVNRLADSKWRRIDGQRRTCNSRLVLIIDRRRKGAFERRAAVGQGRMIIGLRCSDVSRIHRAIVAATWKWQYLRHIWRRLNDVRRRFTLRIATFGSRVEVGIDRIQKRHRLVRIVRLWRNNVAVDGRMFGVTQKLAGQIRDFIIAVGIWRAQQLVGFRSSFLVGFHTRLLQTGRERASWLLFAKAKSGSIVCDERRGKEMLLGR